MTPLSGYRVLDLGTMTPGKYCGYQLVSLGAEVIRIERPPAVPGVITDEDLILNQGKRSITLNLRAEKGKALFLKLAEGADVVLESNRPGAADRGGFGYDAVNRHNPKIIYCAMSGYGATGPLRQAPGYDLVFAAQSGMLHALTGKAASPPAPETYLTDAVSGLMAAYAIVAAVLERERSGEGTFIDLAMHDSLFALLAVSHGVRKAGGRAATAMSPTYNLYPAADGTCIALAAIRPASRRALFQHLGRVELAEADATSASEFLAETLRTKTAAEWVAELAPLDVEIAPLNTPEAAFDDLQLIAREMIGDAAHPVAGEFEYIRPAVHSESPHLTPAPSIGDDTSAILGSLGVGERAIDELADGGVI